MARAGAFLILLWLALAGAALAQTFPPLSGRIVDQAGLLPPDRAARLSGALEGLEERTGAQLVIATVPSLRGAPIEIYGYLLGRHWGIGRAGVDDGVLLLVAPREREVRIEVGYGLEPVLTDALSRRIIERSILPHFRNGEMADGIERGALALVTQLGLSPEEARLRIEEAELEEGDTLVGAIFGYSFLFLMFVIFPVFAMWMLLRPQPPIENWGPPRPLRAPASAPAPEPVADAWDIERVEGGGWAGIKRSLRKAWESMGEPTSSGGSWSSSGSSSWSSGSSGSSSFSGGGGSFGGGGASGRW